MEIVALIDMNQNQDQLNQSLNEELAASIFSMKNDT
jgi:hypothetical protein